MMAMNYIEIYNEQIRDLLGDSPKKAYISEDKSGEVEITNIVQVNYYQHRFFFEIIVASFFQIQFS